MSRYNTIIPNDVVNGEGVCVSFFIQGCPHHCKGCFNPETWDTNGGQPYTPHTKWEIVELINKNGLQRNFSVLGGEPLSLQNIPTTWEVISTIRHAYPHIKIFLWTGYTLAELEKKNNKMIMDILGWVDVLIDGPFIENEKDLSLKLRGSQNQHIYERINNQWIMKE